MSRARSVRYLMLVVAVCAIATLAVRFCLKDHAVSVGSRIDTLFVTVQLLDAQSGRPLGGAWLQKWDADFPERRPETKASTDLSGEATITTDRIIDVVGYASGRRTDTVYHPLWGLRCGKTGYKTAQIASLRGLLGGRGEATRGGLTPSPVVIRLERLND